MKTAPKDCTWVLVELPDGSHTEAHWASDLSGEEQPAFRGWFERGDRGFVEVPDPVRWRHLTNTFGLGDKVKANGWGEGVVTGTNGMKVQVKTGYMAVVEFHCGELALVQTADPEYMI